MYYLLKVITNFRITGVEYTLKENESHQLFYDKIQQILTAQLNQNLIIFPEYCWGSTPINQQQLVLWLRTLSNHPNLVLGSGVVDDNNGKYNVIVVVDRENNIYLIPKKFPLKHEQSHGIKIPTGAEPMFSPNVIELDEVTVGFLVCADLWRADFVKGIVQRGVDIIVCPAMTSTDLGYANYAKFQWYALAIARSREFVVPIVVVDNPIEVDNQITGKATFSCDPSIKTKDMNTITDFLSLPDKDRTLNSEFDFNLIEQYRQYRVAQNLIANFTRSSKKG